MANREPDLIIDGTPYFYAVSESGWPTNLFLTDAGADEAAALIDDAKKQRPDEPIAAEDVGGDDNPADCSIWKLIYRRADGTLCAIYRVYGPNDAAGWADSIEEAHELADELTEEPKPGIAPKPF